MLGSVPRAVAGRWGGRPILALTLVLGGCADEAPAGSDSTGGAPSEFSGAELSTPSSTDAGAPFDAIDSAGPASPGDAGSEVSGDAALDATGAPDAVLRDQSGSSDGGAIAPGGDAGATPGTDGFPSDPPTGDGALGTISLGAAPQILSANPTVNYRGTDAAYDPGSDVFLVAYGNAPIGGAFLDSQGLQVGTGFLLTDEPYDGTNWTQLPRVAFGSGGFLVTWHREQAGVVVQTRRVTYDGGGPSFGGPAVTLSSSGTQQESPAAVAYSPVTDQFLVVWAQQGLKVRRVGSDGTLAGDVVPVSEEGVWVEMPSAVFHPGCGCFFVMFMQEVAGSARVMMARIQDGTAVALGPNADLSGPLSFAKVTDIALDAAAGEVIATWFEVRPGFTGFAAQRLAADGSATTAAMPVFVPHGSYDGYDLAWSPATGTAFAAFHGSESAALGAELAKNLSYGTAVPFDTAGTKNGYFLPRVVAHPSQPFWLVTANPDYAFVVVQRVDWAPAKSN